ncbi:acetyltransferase [Pectobacterium betavasculorum]|uniref:Acetyltransferase n=1 Tax=Pectobacterium betavasculorum TaxID=55207 RepID=A0A093S0Z9_9GAMM|nr:N-acetyltransferase [Pectobacterium betavasculorum]KFX03786.1 acetyltransferase [Pectobacterium betavasculorum]KFX18398.1 acetyltransferase [Pectobacterium betavasculorum]
MIRPYRGSDIEPLMQLWLKSTILAHPFIREDYWRESASAVREIYIPQSQTWVYEEQESLIGFISVLEARFIGALFVEKNYYGKQIGAALIQHVQALFPLLSLEVYQQNTRACRFYHKQGFAIVDENVNRDTQATALIMQWAKQVKEQ